MYSLLRNNPFIILWGKYVYTEATMRKYNIVFCKIIQNKQDERVPILPENWVGKTWSKSSLVDRHSNSAKERKSSCPNRGNLYYMSKGKRNSWLIWRFTICTEKFVWGIYRVYIWDRKEITLEIMIEDIIWRVLHIMLKFYLTGEEYIEIF